MTVRLNRDGQADYLLPPCLSVSYSLEYNVPGLWNHANFEACTEPIWSFIVINDYLSVILQSMIFVGLNLFAFTPV